MRRHALARCRCGPLTARTLRFQPSTDVSGQVSVKSSVQRSIRASILSQWQINPETFEQIWPKKESLTLVKWYVTSHPSIAGRRCAKLFVLTPVSCRLPSFAFFSVPPVARPSALRSREHIYIYTLHGEPLFFQHFDGPFFPTLRLLHKCASRPRSRARSAEPPSLPAL